MKRTLSTAIIVIGLVVAALPALAATSTVTLGDDNKFKPANVSVAVGDTVKFVWNGGFHDVTFADGQKSGAPVGDVGTTFSRTFSTAGSYAYVCTVHEALGMKGTVTVGAAASTSSTGSSSSQLPRTGPEDTLVPLAGGLLALVGLAMYVKTRTQA
jgi:LPXTG-motif cell wall-anchored protein